LFLRAKLFASLLVLTLAVTMLLFVPSPFVKADTTSPGFAQLANAEATSTGQLQKVGTTTPNINTQATTSTTPNVSNLRNPSLVNRRKPYPTTTTQTTMSIPAPSTLSMVSGSNGGSTTAKGLTVRADGLVFGMDFEPPDQGLCVGNGYVLEPVNTVVRMYSTSFASKSSILSLNTLDGLSNLAFTSDPRCLYDTDTGHWFVTQLLITGDGFGPGAPGGFEYLAVSETNVPTAGWNIYVLNVTDSFPHTAHYPGQSNDPNCPCFGDQPLLGANRDAIVISTNEFPIVGAGFNGDHTYLISKNSLALGSSVVPFVYFNIGSMPTPDGNCLTGATAGITCWYSINPAGSPVPSQYDNNHGGTEYALSSLDFFGTGDNRLAAWAFYNTQSLSTLHPTVHLTTSLGSGLESYANFFIPPANGFLAPQKDGPTPLGDLNPSYGFPHSNCPTTPCPQGPIQTNGDGMFDTVVYAQGAMWGGVNSEVSEFGGTQTHAGVAYWVIGASNLHFGLIDQGYVAACNGACTTGEDIMFPSIGVGPTGNGVMAFTLTGPDFFPSSAFVKVSMSSHGSLGSVIYTSATGQGAYDAVTEYENYNAAVGLPGYATVPRWGDYTWAVWSGGKVFFATEYIQYPNCSDSQFKTDPTCGGTRDFFANWGTSLNQVTP